MSRRATKTAGLATLGTVGLLLSLVASAQEAPSTPSVTVIGFRDLPDGQDCDPVEARYGRCVEEVRFVGQEHVYTSFLTSDVEAHARLSSMGELYGWLWDDLAFRWKSDTRIEETMRADGLTKLPEIAAQWGSTPKSADTLIHAVPDEALWMWEDTWIGSTDRALMYPSVRYHQAPGLQTPPEVVVMSGRFAERLVVDGKRHQYDLMDGDIESSGPFFEQMYPYDRALLASGQGDDAGRREEIPLRHFVAEERLKGDQGAGLAERTPEEWTQIRREAYDEVMLPAGGGIGDLERLAQAEFEHFYSTIGIQILQFAREEYTPTHLRVITSLMAMNSPPGVTAALGLDKEGNAGGSGMTDDLEALQEFLDASADPFAFDQTFSISYKELPAKVIEVRLPEFEEWQDEDPEFLRLYTDRVWSKLKDFLRPDMKPITRLDDQSLLAEWANENARAGKSSIIRSQLKQIALELIVTSRPEDERDQIETSLLLDHVLSEIVSRFPSDPEVRFTPVEMEALADEQWKGVLEKHGFYATRIPDGPGVVNPLAVCATKAGTDALSEPVFGKVKVDGLIVAPADLQTPEEVIWAGRDQLPFLMVDNPPDNRPEIRRLFNLPGSRSVYRIRWEMWTGWHLFWAPEAIDPAGEERRVALRTAAFCEDTVLAPPSLAPTLVRAALLEGDFRPPRVASQEQLRIHDATPTAAMKARLDQRLRYADEPAPAAVVVAEEEVSSLDAIAAGGVPKLGRAAPDIDAVPSDTVAYVQALLDPVAERRTTSGPAMLVAFDQSSARGKERTSWFKPRSPYAIDRQKASKDAYVYTAAWAWYRGESVEGERVLAFPNYHPTESVSTDALVQRWRRRASGDWTLLAGLGTFPIRVAQTSCAEQKEGDDPNKYNDTVKPCDGAPSIARTEGFHADVGMLRTQWMSEHPRWAVEFGPMARIEMIHKGLPWLYPGDGDVPTYNWTPKLHVGLVGGLRFAPVGGPLTVKGERHPWGADRPDGSSSIGRSHFGIRAGALLGPGPTGPEATLLGEGWYAWSLPRRRSASATFQPYHPDFFLGPYITGTATYALSEGDYLSLDKSFSAHVGLRIQVGVGQGAKDKLGGG